MSGTKAGAAKRTKTFLKNDPLYYVRIGGIGGRAGFGPEYRKGGSKASGFAARPELASYYGSLGQRKGRKRKTDTQENYYQTLLDKQRS